MQRARLSFKRVWNFLKDYPTANDLRRLGHGGIGISGPPVCGPRRPVSDVESAKLVGGSFNPFLLQQDNVLALR